MKVLFPFSLAVRLELSGFKLACSVRQSRFFLFTAFILTAICLYFLLRSLSFDFGVSSI